MWRFLRNIIQREIQSFQIQKCALSKCIMDLDKAYVAVDLEQEKYRLSFVFNEDGINLPCKFMFNRNLNESVSALVTKIQNNINIKRKRKLKKKQQVSNNSVIEDINVQLFLGNDELNSSLQNCRDIFCLNKLNPELHLKVNDHVYKVIVNAPWIESCVLPEKLLTNSIQYPRKMTGFEIQKDNIEFSWYKSKDLKNWQFLADGCTYWTTDDDCGFYLKLSCLPSNQYGTGAKFEVVSKDTVQEGPKDCPFMKRHQFTKDILVDNRFRVVSYNILASIYTNSDYSKEVLFPYCSESILNKNYRRQLLIKEILGYNGDIVCLQEVDAGFFNYDLLFVLKNFSYEGDFCKKLKLVDEGSACFYKTTRFILLNTYRCSYVEEIEKCGEICNKIDNKIKEKMNDLRNCFQVLVLKSKDVDEILIVANTHLYFHPNGDNIRFLQSVSALSFLSTLLDDLQHQFSSRISTIFCGDFNSTPDCAIFEHFTTGKVSSSVSDWKCVDFDYMRKLQEKTTILLKSACGSPKYTHFTPIFSGCIDYIFCDKYNLDVDQVVPFLTEEELSEHIAIPSVVHPSDHVALVADLKWT